MSKTKVRVWFLCSVAVLLGATVTARPGGAVTVEFIGEPSQGLSPENLSPDGRTVFSHSPSSIWTRQTGVVEIELPEISGYLRPPGARFASADGSVLAGNAGIGEEVPGRGTRVDEKVAVRWDAINGYRQLDGLEGGPNESMVRGVSADGSVIIGNSYFTDNDYEAVRWTNEGQVLEPLGHLGISDIYREQSLPGDVSADGSVIVGYSSDSEGKTRAFRWTQETGMQPLDDSPVTAQWSRANAVSPDGTRIVGEGRAGFQQPHQAFLWDEDGGTQGLGWLPIEAFGYAADDANVRLDESWATATSDDGSIVVGRSGILVQIGDGAISVFDSRHLPFVWTPTTGMMQPADFLQQVHGFTLDGVQVTEIADVSADGRTLLAEGVDELDRPLAMLLHLDANRIPEPTTVCLAAIAVAALALHRFRRPSTKVAPKADDSPALW